MQDELRTCIERDCNKEFTLSAREIEWYDTHGLVPPRRCKECRIKNRARHEAQQQEHGH